MQDQSVSFGNVYRLVTEVANDYKLQVGYTGSMPPTFSITASSHAGWCINVRSINKARKKHAIDKKEVYMTLCSYHTSQVWSAPQIDCTMKQDKCVMDELRQALKETVLAAPALLDESRKRHIERIKEARKRKREEEQEDARKDEIMRLERRALKHRDEAARWMGEQRWVFWQPNGPADA